MLEPKKDKEGKLLPFQYGKRRRVAPMEDVLLFFQQISPKERAYKVIFLLMAGARIRVSEACALHMDDFIKNSKFRTFDVRIQKKNVNYIEQKNLPESISAILRGWIWDNKKRISKSGGWVFPHTNKGYPHKRAVNVDQWCIRKRRQLKKLFPGRSFGWTMSPKPKEYKNYDVFKIKKTPGKEYQHVWTPHLMKRLSGTLIQYVEKNPSFTQAMLSHERVDTTERYYIDQAYLLEEKESKVMNKIFDKNFFDSVVREDESAVSVFEELKSL
jgi:integrase